ncbi:hypothetical protein [Legionella quateirensis]|uniref:Uncharacterized protein n=1 Tax=Legionella quateirensis TaxID=45072 RepID=A0A378KWC8_9GAMM|nr:hypothetical protein [Legionella quateirensis]KTD50853.1 hypothetical protein Lqua_1080 [Legionella quateirensis]STY17901.1 Uncharacterised protein [Legionella quateirensis]
MRLKLFTLSEEHKNILRAQKKLVHRTLDTIAVYLVKNKAVPEEWREKIKDEAMINYYDVIPKGKRLRSPEIDLEVIMSRSNGEVETKIYKKNANQANASLIAFVKKALLERQSKLIAMKNNTIDSVKLDHINKHLQQTERFIDDCLFLKISSQLLIAEVGALHHAENIYSGITNSITKPNNIEYLKLINYIDGIKEVIKRHALIDSHGDRVAPGSRLDVAETRQKFNFLYSTIHDLYTSIAQKGLLDLINHKPAELYFEHEFYGLKQMFFAKNDVNYTWFK